MTRLLWIRFLSLFGARAWRTPVAAYTIDGHDYVVCDDGSLWISNPEDVTWYRAADPIPGTSEWWLFGGDRKSEGVAE